MPTIETNRTPTPAPERCPNCGADQLKIDELNIEVDYKCDSRYRYYRRAGTQGWAEQFECEMKPQEVYTGPYVQAEFSYDF